MILKRIVSFLTSLRVTVVCLTLALALVFFGTLAQVDLGLYKAQNEFFRSFLIYWGPKGASWKIPVFPGGYLVGSVLMANLVAAHIQRFRLEKKKIGIVMIHTGLIAMILGQLLTDLMARESTMHIRVGATRNYSESSREFEIAAVDVSDPKTDKVVAIPEEVVAKSKVIQHPEMPFSITIQQFFPNSAVSKTNEAGFTQVPLTSSNEPALWWKEIPRVTTTEERDLASALVELKTPQGSLGNMLVSAYLDAHALQIGNKVFEISLRPKRHYKPFSLHLENFNHGVYKGTMVAKDYSSTVKLQRPETGENREVRIYMNNPLRYNGETFYQASYDPDDGGTILQVVHNPSWLTPYISCGLVGLGMFVQFGMSLYGFIKKRVKA